MFNIAGLFAIFKMLNGGNLPFGNFNFIFSSSGAFPLALFNMILNLATDNTLALILLNLLCLSCWSSLCNFLTIFLKSTSLLLFVN